MPGIFLGRNFQVFQACVFFWVCNMKLRRTPPSCILRVPPPWACDKYVLKSGDSVPLKVGFKSLINNVSFFLICKSSSTN